MVNNVTHSARIHTGLFALVILTAISTNGLEFLWVGATFTPERILAFPLWLIGLFLLIGRGGARWPKYTPFLLVGWLSLSLLSSSFSEVSDWSIRMWVSLVIATSYYFFIFIYNVRPYAMVSSVWFYSLSWLFGAFSVAIYFLSVVLDIDLTLSGIWLQEGSGGTRIRAAITEANIFGVFLIFIILVNIAICKRKTWHFYLLMIFLNVSMVLSFSRSPWASFLIAYLFYIYLKHPKVLSFKQLGSWMIPLVVSLIILLSISYYLFERLGDIELLSRTNTIDARFIMWTLAVEDIATNPLLGNGVFSFSALHPNAPSEVGSESYRSAWISNIFLAFVHDFGLVGSLIFSAFFLVLFVRGIKVVRNSAISLHSLKLDVKLTAALLSSCFALVISGQTIPTHSLAFFWLVLALLEKQIILLKSSLHSNVFTN